MSQSENVTNLRCVAYFVFLLSKLFHKLQLQSCLAVLTACGVFRKAVLGEPVSAMDSSHPHSRVIHKNCSGNLFAVFFSKDKRGWKSDLAVSH